MARKEFGFTGDKGGACRVRPSDTRSVRAIVRHFEKSLLGYGHSHNSIIRMSLDYHDGKPFVLYVIAAIPPLRSAIAERRMFCNIANAAYAMHSRIGTRLLSVRIGLAGEEFRHESDPAAMREKERLEKQYPHIRSYDGLLAMLAGG